MPCSKGIRLATSYRTRIKGLLGAFLCDCGEVLALIPCNSIHTFFMRDDLDVAFIDSHGQVILSVRGLRPWKTLAAKSAVCVLERRVQGNQPWFVAGEHLSLTTLHGRKGEHTEAGLDLVTARTGKKECNSSTTTTSIEKEQS